MDGFSKMRERIEVLVPVDGAANDFNETSVTYAGPTNYTTWARVERMENKETSENETLKANATYKITIRYRSDFSTENKITWRSQTLAISSFLSDERRTTLEIIAHD